MTKAVRGAVVIAAVVVLAGCAGRDVAGPTQRIFPEYDYEASPEARRPDVSGGYLITLDDADPPFANFPADRRRPPDSDAGDTLTVVRLPLGNDDLLPVAQIELPTTVAGPKQPIDISSDGSLALVLTYDGRMLERLAGRSGGVIAATGVVPVDLSDPMNPVLGEVYPLSEEMSALSVAIRPQGDLALVGGHGTEELLFLVLDGPRIAHTISSPTFGDDAEPKRPTGIQWHPSGRGFAVCLAGYRHVAFYELVMEAENDMIEIRHWGTPVRAHPYPFTGVFSPDGEYFFSTDLAWSIRTNWFESASVGFVSVYKVDQTMGPDAVHERLGSVSVGRSPTTIAVSPDGSLIVVGNVEGGLVPLPADRSPNATDGGLLHLIRHDGQGGLEILTEVATTLIPAGVTFTPDGGHVLVAGYDENIVAIWEIQEIEGAPRLVDTTFGIETGTGPHAVRVIP